MAGSRYGITAAHPAVAREVGDANLAPGFMARALAALFGAGATLALLTVALPHAREANELALLLIVGDAYVVAALLYTYARRVSRTSLNLALAWGSTLVAAVAYFSAQSPSPLIFFFLWVFLYASYFFTTRETALQIVYVGVAYGALLAARTPADGFAEWWLVGMGTLLVAAMLVRSMRERGESLIARLYDAGRSDPLTGLLNRRGFRELLDLELERARRAESDVAIVLGDLDHFKEVNDRAGQVAGDAVLREVAEALRSSGRALDTVARVGGAEFGLLLPDTDCHEAFSIAERVRARVGNELSRGTVPTTISLGVAAYPQHAETAAALVHAAENALHAAKENGRDRTVLHSAALPPRTANGMRDVAGERFVAVVIDLADAVDLRFSGSARHAETVGRYAEMMAAELGLPEKRVERVRLAGMLHDVGKVGVPDSVLQKPAKLTDEEFGLIKRHPQLGEQILEHESLADVRSWVGAHHERPDGRGYPRGLTEREIPLEAKILAVADAYEAMTSDRAYRSALGHVAAQAELKRCSGSQFDPRVVEALLNVLAREGEHASAVAAPADGALQR